MRVSSTPPVQSYAPDHAEQNPTQFQLARFGVRGLGPSLASARGRERERETDTETETETEGEEQRERERERERGGGGGPPRRVAVAARTLGPRGPPGRAPGCAGC